MESLISTDRCDGCGVQAYVRFSKDDYQLDFCSHHTTKHGDALDESGWNIAIDTRDLLTNRAVGAEVK